MRSTLVVARSKYLKDDSVQIIHFFRARDFAVQKRAAYTYSNFAAGIMEWSNLANGLDAGDTEYFIFSAKKLFSVRSYICMFSLLYFLLNSTERSIFSPIHAVQYVFACKIALASKIQLIKPYNIF